MTSPVPRLWWLVLAVAVPLAVWPAIAPGDAAVADQMWDAAIEVSGGDLTRRIFVDVAEAQRRIAPWQEAWPRARERLAAIEEARRAALPHDRGGVRGRVHPVDESL